MTHAIQDVDQADETQSAAYRGHTRRDRWLRTHYVAPSQMHPAEIAVRDIIGFEWDATHNPRDPERFNRPISIIAVPDGHDTAQTFVISLPGTPSRGSAVLEHHGYFGFLIPTGEQLFEAELATLRKLVETAFGLHRQCIPIGTMWISQGRDGRPIPFPSGQSWDDLLTRDQHA